MLNPIKSFKKQEKKACSCTSKKNGCFCVREKLKSLWQLLSRDISFDKSAYAWQGLKGLARQKGRTMLEMLGVLAIMGILSLAGFYLHRLSINHHHANQIADDAERLAFVIYERLEDMPKGDIQDMEGYMQKADFSSNANYEYQAKKISKGGFYIDVFKVLPEECMVLLPKVESKHVVSVISGGMETYHDMGVTNPGTICQAPATEKTITVRFHFDGAASCAYGVCGTECCCPDGEEYKEDVRGTIGGVGRKKRCCSKDKKICNCGGRCVSQDCPEGTVFSEYTCACEGFDPLGSLCEQKKIKHCLTYNIHSPDPNCPCVECECGEPVNGVCPECPTCTKKTIDCCIRYDEESSDSTCPCKESSCIVPGSYDPNACEVDEQATFNNPLQTCPECPWQCKNGYHKATRSAKFCECIPDNPTEYDCVCPNNDCVICDQTKKYSTPNQTCPLTSKFSWMPLSSALTTCLCKIPTDKDNSSWKCENVRATNPRAVDGYCPCGNVCSDCTSEQDPCCTEWVQDSTTCACTCKSGKHYPEICTPSGGRCVKVCNKITIDRCDSYVEPDEKACTSLTETQETCKCSASGCVCVMPSGHTKTNDPGRNDKYKTNSTAVLTCPTTTCPCLDTHQLRDGYCRCKIRDNAHLIAGCSEYDTSSLTNAADGYCPCKSYKCVKPDNMCAIPDTTATSSDVHRLWTTTYETSCTKCPCDTANGWKEGTNNVCVCTPPSTPVTNCIEYDETSTTKTPCPCLSCYCAKPMGYSASTHQHLITNTPVSVNSNGTCPTWANAEEADQKCACESGYELRENLARTTQKCYCLNNTSRSDCLEDDNPEEGKGIYTVKSGSCPCTPRIETSVCKVPESLCVPYCQGCCYEFNENVEVETEGTYCTCKSSYATTGRIATSGLFAGSTFYGWEDYCGFSQNCSNDTGCKRQCLTSPTGGKSSGKNCKTEDKSKWVTIAQINNNTAWCDCATCNCAVPTDETKAKHRVTSVTVDPTNGSCPAWDSATAQQKCQCADGWTEERNEVCYCELPNPIDPKCKAYDINNTTITPCPCKSGPDGGCSCVMPSGNAGDHRVEITVDPVNGVCPTTTCPCDEENGWYLNSNTGLCETACVPNSLPFNVTVSGTVNVCVAQDTTKKYSAANTNCPCLTYQCIVPPTPLCIYDRSKTYSNPNTLCPCIDGTTNPPIPTTCSWSNLECPTGYFCYFGSPSSCGDEGPGICIPISDFPGVEKSASDGYKWLRSSVHKDDSTLSLNWWSAQSWCIAQGLTPASTDSLDCSPGVTCSSTRYANLRSAYSSSPDPNRHYWLEDRYNDCDANVAEASSNTLAGLYRNEGLGHYALCENGCANGYDYTYGECRVKCIGVNQSVTSGSTCCEGLVNYNGFCREKCTQFTERDCSNDYYCHVYDYNSNCNPVGACIPVQNKATKTLSDGSKWAYNTSSNYFDWWSAQSWCVSQGYQPATHYNMCCQGPSSASTCYSTIVYDLGSQLPGYYPFWLQQVDDWGSCAAYYSSTGNTYPYNNTDKDSAYYKPLCKISGGSCQYDCPSGQIKFNGECVPTCSTYTSKVCPDGSFCLALPYGYYGDSMYGGYGFGYCTAPTGVCVSLDNYQSKELTAPTGKYITLASYPDILDWYSAQSWCVSQGYQPAAQEDFYTDDRMYNIADYEFWLNGNINACYAMYAYSGNPDSSWAYHLISNAADKGAFLSPLCKTSSGQTCTSWTSASACPSGQFCLFSTTAYGSELPNGTCVPPTGVCTDLSLYPAVSDNNTSTLGYAITLADNDNGNDVLDWYSSQSWCLSQDYVPATQSDVNAINNVVSNSVSITTWNNADFWLGETTSNACYADYVSAYAYEYVGKTYLGFNGTYSAYKSEAFGSIKPICVKKHCSGTIEGCITYTYKKSGSDWNCACKTCDSGYELNTSTGRCEETSCATDGYPCWSNDDCCSTSFCLFTDSSSECDKGSGVCAPLGTIEEVTIAGKKWTRSDSELSWWSASNWCKAQGMRVATREDIGCLIYCGSDIGGVYNRYGSYCSKEYCALQVDDDYYRESQEFGYPGSVLKLLQEHWTDDKTYWLQYAPQESQPAASYEGAYCSAYEVYFGESYVNTQTLQYYEYALCVEDDGTCSMIGCMEFDSECKCVTCSSPYTLVNGSCMHTEEMDGVTLYSEPVEHCSSYAWDTNQTQGCAECSSGYQVYKGLCWKQCEQNSDCSNLGSYYFCAFDNGNPSYEGEEGRCLPTSILSGEPVTFTYNNTQYNWWRTKDRIFSWWTTQNWCTALGRQPISLSTIDCSPGSICMTNLALAFTRWNDNDGTRSEYWLDEKNNDEAYTMSGLGWNSDIDQTIVDTGEEMKGYRGSYAAICSACPSGKVSDATGRCCSQSIINTNGRCVSQ